MPDRGGQGLGARIGPPSRRAKVLLLTVGVLVLLFLGFVLFAGFWTDWLWFKSVHYASVFSTEVRTKVALFGVFGLVMALVTGVNTWVAHRLRPPLSAMSVEQQSLDRYRMGLAPFRKWLLIGSSLLVGLVAGAAASGQWRLWLLWTNATDFGVKDSQFHLDVAFYAFDLPWYEFLLGFAFSAVVVSLIAALLVHYLYGGLRLQGPGRRASSGAQGHLAVLLGLFVLLKAVAYWLDRYALAVKTASYKGVPGYTGLRYVDANAVLPAKTILFCVAIICAVLFFLTPVRRTWAPALVGFGLMALSAVLIGGLYPAIVQQFQVKPNEQAKETPYLQQNIDATRQAYGIAGAQSQVYTPSPTADAAKVQQDSQTISDIRLLDPNLVSPTFQQMEQQRSYYGFPSTLDVDRYPTTTDPQDTVIGVRELNPSGVQQHNWINDHFKYTHGFGVVAAKGNQVNANGQPVFTESGLPATGDLGSYEQRIYYGENTTTYSIVDGSNHEIDNTADAGAQTYQYTGDSGVSLNNPLTRAAYAVKFSEPQILYSGAITTGAKVLYDRTPQERVAKVAPWLAIDGDPYPVVEDGHLTWVLDGYTTSDGYPFSSKTTLGDATKDSLSSERGQVSGDANQVDYIRNSVKATVDAFTGQVTLYQWDDADPVLKTWMKAFPGTVQPRSAIPAALLPHLRYPQDLFKVQRDLLGMYHMTDPNAFFNGTDIWQVPGDPTNGGSQPQPPYYLTLRMPDMPAATFSLNSTFVPSGRPNLAALMSVDADPGPDYGKIRILTVPTDSNTPGPSQVQAKFNSDSAVASQITLLKNGSDSNLDYGNLLTLPVGGGFLNVEPVYVKGSSSNYPVLQKVLAVYGNDNVAFEDSLKSALTQVIGAAPGVTDVAPVSGAGGSGGGGGGGGGAGTVAATDPALKQALAAAQKAETDAQNAVKAGDWTAFGAAQKALQDAINAAVAAEQKGAGGASAAPSPTAAAPPPATSAPPSPAPAQPSSPAAAASP
ncbi:UPF0182 family protein [Kitasatospora sp. NBC_01287]|uniref:UPF0182 family membrane protein n=1 Tax=Kitasatospora sp. NBC_01287 TaxID=2903573 RepID=UPI00225C33A9|nr:UPF0182 family protein [Kitasatospora sp. NBC_01287]MCX4746857.1 UPF0182 family protein [Kitasatospora sp. NBC_01287]